jgi:hypothetical protein
MLIISAFIVAVAPIFPDISPSHLFNEDWPPHARFHMAWLLALMFVLGSLTIAGAILIPDNQLALLRTVAFLPWLVLIGFITAVFTVDLYGGSINAYENEVMVIGLNGNSFGFLVASIFLTAAHISLWRKR